MDGRAAIYAAREGGQNKRCLLIIGVCNEWLGNRKVTGHIPRGSPPGASSPCRIGYLSSGTGSYPAGGGGERGKSASMRVHRINKTSERKCA